MAEKIRAFVLHNVNDLRMDWVEMPTLKPDQALVKVKAVGICGSDIHYYRNGRIGPFILRKPMILGHECAGEVVEVGPEVTNLKVGDRVVIEPGVPCRKCWYCRNGRYNKCAKVTFMATPPDDGSLVEYIAHPSDYLFKMPDSMSFQDGALVEPLSVGLHAVRRSGLYPAASVAILGAGPIGLVTLEMVKAVGAGPVIMADVISSRLSLAKKMGATHVINAREENVVEKIRELTDKEGVHFVFETAGASETVRQTVEVAREGGIAVLIGLTPDLEIPMPMIDFIAKEVNLVCVFRYCNVFEEAVTLMAHNRVNVKPIMTNQFPFDRTVEAFEVAEKEKDKSVKVVVNL
jgi:L-iditol 2-dehydrogenase